MTAIDPDSLTADEARDARRARLFSRITTADKWFQVLGLSWITPVLRATAGDNPKGQLTEIWRLLGVPVLAIGLFLIAWASLAPQVQTSLGAIPGPSEVWTEAVNLHKDAQNKAASEARFQERVDQRNARLIEQGRADEVKDIAYTGAPSYYDQIATSIGTVFFWLPNCEPYRHSLGYRRRAFALCQCSVEPANSDLQAGFATSMVADCDHGGLSSLRHQ